MKRVTVPIERIREVFEYSPETGAVRWRVKLNRKIVVGSLAGSASHGYLKVKLDGTEMLLHRLAWAHHHGCWPEQTIDHINGNRSDNRIANLRDVPFRVNAQNQRRAHSDNATGLLGVVAKDGRYLARIKADGRVWTIGEYETPEEAHAAYVAEKRQVHEGCTL